MRKVWISAAVAAFSLLAALGALFWGGSPKELVAAETVQFLRPWPVEVWRPGADAILGGGLSGSGPDRSGGREEAFLYSPGKPLRSYTFTAENVQVGDRIVKVLKSDGTLLGIKHDPSAIVQSAMAPSGTFALITTDNQVALVRGDDVQLVGPAFYQGTDLASWRSSLSARSLFSYPMVSDSGAFALRVMVPDKNGVPVVSVWRGDIGSEPLHPVLIGKEGEANNLAGFLPDGRLVVWDLDTGVFAIDAKGNVSRIGRADLTAESISGAGLVFSVDTVDMQPHVITAGAQDLPLQGLPDKTVFSYGASWAPGGTRVAFLAGDPAGDPNLIVAEVDGGSFRVTDVYSSPDPAFRFAAEGSLGWANDSDLVVSTWAKEDGNTVKAWVFKTGGEGAR